MSTIRDLCNKELNNPKREKIWNNGRYFDTHEIYELWEIAFNLGLTEKVCGISAQTSEEFSKKLDAYFSAEARTNTTI